MKKVFCIGLGKTGTTTFGACMEKLGYKHHPTICRFGLTCYRSNRLNLIFKATKDYDSFDDFPWPLMYKEIADYYPDSLFVLTYRKNVETWYNSLCRHYDRTGPTLSKRLAYGYDSPYENPGFHKSFYEKHNYQVQSYFEESGRLLKLCWENGDGWEELCRFLKIQSIPQSKIYRLKGFEKYRPIEEINYLIKKKRYNHAEKRALYHSQSNPKVYEYFLKKLYKEDILIGRLRQTVKRISPNSWRK